MKTILMFLFLTAVVSTSLSAQNAPPMPMFPSEPAAAPIDGGLGLLAAAGGAYALRKLRQRNKS